jgi:hypothetical protein
MEPGFIDGTYLTWVTGPIGTRSVARVVTGGIGATRLGKGMWPSHLAAFR